MENDPRIPIGILGLARDELAVLKQRLREKDMLLREKDMTIASLRSLAGHRDGEIETLTAEVEQYRAVCILPVPSPSFHLPVLSSSFRGDIDLDTVSLKPFVKEKFVKFGKWLPAYIEAVSAPGKPFVPDHHMYRLWLGISSHTALDNLTNSQINRLCMMMRDRGVITAAQLPAGLKPPQKRGKILEFTGFSKTR